MTNALLRTLEGAARLVLPQDGRKKAFRNVQRLTRWPPVGSVQLGDLRRITPISSNWGFDRGTPVDRYYIERFLSERTADVRGCVLEVADNEYTRRFGADEVTQSDILHDVEGSPRANVVADLAAGDPIPTDAYDCVICTQTLQLIYDVRAAIRTLHRILKPGGVLLATVPTITQISGTDMERTGDYWRFTSVAARRLFEDEFAGSVEIGRHGNVLAAIAFLHGIATEELSQEELNEFVPDYEVLITIRAVKARATL
jgi:SAM-dependent methyltransferase